MTTSRTTATVVGMAALVFWGVLIPSTLRAESTPEEPTRSYALIVANNDSVNPDVESLEYADDDGARYYEMFRSMTDRAVLLTTLDADSQRIFPEIAGRSAPPTRDQLERAVDRLSKSIDRDRAAGRNSEVYLIFTGHGNVDETGEGYLSLVDSKLRRSDLYRDVIRPLDATYTHLIIDACHAYHLVHPRGGDKEWEDDRSGQRLDRQLEAYLTDRRAHKQETLRRVGVIVSTTGSAEVHEWSRYRAGVFSHELRSGLLGAADADGDGAVTYAEIEAYLVAANAAVQNPRARIEVYAHPPKQQHSRPLSSLDDYDNATILEIPKGEGGRYHLEDSRGLRYADFHIDGVSPTRIALLQAPVDGSYYLRSDDRWARVSLDGLTVRSTELAFNDANQQARGPVDEAFRTELFETPYGPAFVRGFRAGRTSRRPVPPSRSDAPSDDWSFEFTAQYGLGTTSADLARRPSDRGAVEHQADIGATFRHRSGWGVGPFIAYGGSLPREGARIHRFSGGIEGSYALPLASNLRFESAARAGHSAFLLRRERLRSDPLALRTSGSVALDWRIAPGAALVFEPGVAANLYTIDYDDRPNRERWSLTPFARLGVRF